MRMEQIEVSLASDGMIVISQTSGNGDGSDNVYIAKEQAALLCKWILAAAKETKNG